MTRPLWTIAGVICFILGWIGLILPMMPGFVFLLGAVFCFARGHPAWEQRMLEHPVYGPPLRDWRERRVISRKAKKSALLFMAIAGAITSFVVGFPMALLPAGSLTLVGIWIWTRAE